MSIPWRKDSSLAKQTKEPQERFYSPKVALLWCLLSHEWFFSVVFQELLGKSIDWSFVLEAQTCLFSFFDRTQAQVSKLVKTRSKKLASFSINSRKTRLIFLVMSFCSCERFLRRFFSSTTYWSKADERSFWQNRSFWLFTDNLNAKGPRSSRHFYRFLKIRTFSFVLHFWSALFLSKNILNHWKTWTLD